METHGTADETTPYAGDIKDTWYGPYYGTETVIEDWAKWHQLDDYELTKISKCARGYNIDLHRYSSASDGTDVRLYELFGAPHDWPKNLGDKTTSSVIWDFFKSHLAESGAEFLN